MKARYDHLCLTVGDLDRSIAFYERYFGLKCVRRDKPHKGEIVEDMTGVKGGELLAAFVTDGHFVLEMVQFTKAQSERTRGLRANDVGCPHMGFSFPDVREVYRQWSAEGVPFLNAPMMSSRGDSWSVMLTDPDGITIELREGPAVSAEMMRGLETA